jgi:hypothetical protein
MSYFLLSVPCSATNTTFSITGSTIIGDDATYTRSTTNADGSPCLTVPTSLTRDGDGDLVLTKSSSQPFAQGVVKVPFWAQPGVDPATNTIQGNFLADKNPIGWITLSWCPTILFDANGNYVPLSGVPTTGTTPAEKAATAAAYLVSKGLSDQDLQPGAAGTNNNLFQYACVLDRTVKYVPGGSPTFKTVDSVYVLGDWYGR